MTGTRERAVSWAGPIAITALGGVLRFAALGQPHAFVFDETYYAKDAWSLLHGGVEQDFVNDVNPIILGSDGTNLPEILTGKPSFIVHPPVGKWLIAAGEHAFGFTPFGWRFVVAVLGTLSILVLARAVRRLTGSTLWGCVAGLLLAVDGMAIVTSRTAVLDGILMFFVLGAFALLLIDRDRSRRSRAPGHWLRPWRWAAAICLGLACGVKWSGIYYVAAFLLLTVMWDVAHRRRAGERWFPAFVRDAVPAGLTMLGIVAAVYLAGWWGWFTSDGGWGRNWAGGQGPVAALSSLWHYHAEMWHFHTHLSTEHGYRSSAFGWLLQARPTSFYYDGADTSCDTGYCSMAVTALGNPVIWWAGTLALLHQCWRWFAHRDWRSGAVLLGVLAGWAPWLFLPDRTMFTFYSIVLLPFLVIGLTLSLAWFANPATTALMVGDGGPAPDRNGRYVLVAMFLIACVLAAWFFYPVWSGALVDHVDWSRRMWFPSWV